MLFSTNFPYSRLVFFQLYSMIRWNTPFFFYKKHFYKQHMIGPKYCGAYKKHVQRGFYKREKTVRVLRIAAFLLLTAFLIVKHVIFKNTKVGFKTIWFNKIIKELSRYTNINLYYLPALPRWLQKWQNLGSHTIHFSSHPYCWNCIWRMTQHRVFVAIYVNSPTYTGMRWTATPHHLVSGRHDRWCVITVEMPMKLSNFTC